MVIGKEFAWAHIPKTGGCTTLALFEMFPELLEHTDPSSSNSKHSLFRDRENELEGKMLVGTIRRLPEWMLDRAMHETLEGVWPDYPAPADALAARDLPDAVRRRVDLVHDRLRPPEDRPLAAPGASARGLPGSGVRVHGGRRRAPASNVRSNSRQRVDGDETWSLCTGSPPTRSARCTSTTRSGRRSSVTLYREWPRLPAPGEAVAAHTHDHHDHAH